MPEGWHIREQHDSCRVFYHFYQLHDWSFSIFFISSLPIHLGLARWQRSRINLPMQEMWVWSPRLGRSPGEGNGSPLQYSCLGDPTDRGAWRATVRGVAKTWAWLKESDVTEQLSTNAHTHTQFTLKHYFFDALDSQNKLGGACDVYRILIF